MTDESAWMDPALFYDGKCGKMAAKQKGMALTRSGKKRYNK